MSATTLLNGTSHSGYQAISIEGEDVNTLYPHRETDNKIVAVAITTGVLAVTALVAYGWSIYENWTPVTISHGNMAGIGIGVGGLTTLGVGTVVWIRRINTRARALAQQILGKNIELGERLTKEESRRLREASDKSEADLRNERVKFASEKGAFEKAANDSKAALAELQATLKASQLSSPASVHSRRRESIGGGGIGGISSPIASPGGGSSPVTVAPPNE